jgi:hypothetical protein
MKDALKVFLSDFEAFASKVYKDEASNPMLNNVIERTHILWGVWGENEREERRWVACAEKRFRDWQQCSVKGSGTIPKVQIYRLCIWSF